MPFDDGTRHGTALCVWSGRNTRDLVVERDPGGLALPAWYSRLWICPWCGEVWMRECLVDSGKVCAWDIIQAGCGCIPQAHGWPLFGSLTLSTRDPLDTLSTLPLELARREVDLLLGVAK